jgi:hypothetical protein
VAGYTPDQPPAPVSPGRTTARRIPRKTLHKRFSQHCQSHSSVYRCKRNKVRELLATALHIYFTKTIISRHHGTSRRRGTRHISFNGAGSRYTRIYRPKRVSGSMISPRSFPCVDPMEKRKSSPVTAAAYANKPVELLIRVRTERSRYQVKSQRKQRITDPYLTADRKQNDHPGQCRSRTSPRPPVAWTQGTFDAPIFDSNAVTEEQHGKLNRQTPSGTCRQP